MKNFSSEGKFSKIDGAPGALVLGGGITALGTLRALMKLRVETTVCPPTGGDLVCDSRFFKPSPDSFIQANFAEQLRASSLPPTVLFPCSDMWVEAVAKLPKDLQTRFPSSTPDIDCAERFLDKDKFRATLEELSIPHPLTISLDSEADLSDERLQGFGEMFIKPRESQKFFATFRCKAWRISSPEEARRKFCEAREKGLAVVLQDYVPGPASNHLFIDGFLDSTGTIRALFARTRLRIYPPDFGNSTFMKSIALADVPQAVDSLRRLLPPTKYRGIFSAEFKRDERDGVYRILEVNVRPWWYVGFAVSSGVDVIELAYRDALGLAVPNVQSYRVGATCVYPYYDYAALKEAGGFSMLSWLGEILGAEQPVFSWVDPWPAIKASAKLLRETCLN